MTGFKRALDHVLQYEGGFVDHPLDKGGATNRGITTATYDAWRKAQGLPTRSVKLISMDEVERIYFEQYWLKVGAHQLPPALAFVSFDAATNHGVHRALVWLDETKDWRVIVAHRLNFYASLDNFAAFGRGWTRRMASVTRVAAELDDQGTVGTNRSLLVFDGDGRQAAVVGFTGKDLLIRVRGDRVYVRPDNQ